MLISIYYIKYVEVVYTYTLLIYFTPASIHIKYNPIYELSLGF